MPQHVQIDRTAVFTLEADGAEGNEFKVDEFTRFTLPPDKGGSVYKLVSVDEKQVVVEYTDDDGKIRSVNIMKKEVPEKEVPEK